MITHRARTTEQLLTAACQGEQFLPRDFAARFQRDPHDPVLLARRAAMTAAYELGMTEARDRLGLYDLTAMQRERRHVTSAYELATTEPAISYLVGYATILDDAILQRSAR